MVRRQGRVIPNHPDLPAHLQNLEPEAPSPVRRVLRRAQRANRRDRQAKALAAPLPLLPPPELQQHEDFYPDFPEDWIDVTAEASEDYLLPTHAANVPSRTIYSVAEGSAATMQSAPSGVRDSVMALRDIDTELHEHVHTVHGIKDLVLASEAPRYQLRCKRQPRYKCGTCELRDCVCLMAVNENRGFPLEPGEFLRKGEKRKA